MVKVKTGQKATIPGCVLGMDILGHMFNRNSNHKYSNLKAQMGIYCTLPLVYSC